MNGEPQKVKVIGDKEGETSGSYVAHLEGHPSGYIKNNRNGKELQWKSKGYSLKETNMQNEWAKKIEERNALRMQEEDKTAKDLLKEVSLLNPIHQATPYLKDKQIQPSSKIFTDKEGLVTYIPAIDEHRKLWNLQTIQADGTQSFAKNSRKEGCFHPIEGLEALSKAPILVITEGYASAESLSQALGFSTIAAFEAENLEKVALALKAKHPEKPILIAGDDDKHQELTQGTNSSKEKAQQAAHSVNGKTIFPIFAPDEQSTHPQAFKNFNDLASKSKLGLEGVKRQVQSVVDTLTKEKEVARGLGLEAERKEISMQKQGQCLVNLS